MSERAIVLRCRPVGDHDVLVDCLTETQGRLTARAKGARRSRRRFGSALETGAVIVPVFGHTQSGRLPLLTDCDLLSAPLVARSDLPRFYQLAYILELGQSVSAEGCEDIPVFKTVHRYLTALEAYCPCHEELVAFELMLLTHYGVQLQFWPCVQSGEVPNALSLSAGGAIDSRLVARQDSIHLQPKSLEKLYAISQGAEPWFEDDEHQAVRSMFNYLWPMVVGRNLKSAQFIGPDAFGGSPESVDGPIIANKAHTGGAL